VAGENASSVQEEAIMRAKDVMTKTVIAVGPNDTILRAIRLMLQNRVSGLPVIDDAGGLVGIVTEGDFLRRSETGTEHRAPRWIEFLMGPGPLATEYVHSNGRKVSEVMTSDVRYVAEDASLEDVVNLMEKYYVKRLPVVRDKKIIGIVSRSNIVRAVAMKGRQAATTGASTNDSEIRKQLIALLETQRWAPTGTMNVEVRDGTVTFAGTIFDDRERDALRVAAENISGVRDVIDEMVWIDPGSGYVVDPPPRKAS
jgi:CBS domain-containing protein